jgi:hypothetical protein
MGLLKKIKHSTHHSSPIPAPPVHVAPSPVHVTPPKNKPKPKPVHVSKPSNTSVDDKLEKAMNGHNVTTLDSNDPNVNAAPPKNKSTWAGAAKESEKATHTTSEANTTSDEAKLLNSKSTVVSSNTPASASAIGKDAVVVEKDPVTTTTVSDTKSLKNPNTDAQLLDSTNTTVSNNVPASVSNHVSLPDPLPVISNNDASSSLNDMETKKSNEHIKNHIKHDEKKGEHIAKKQTSKSAINNDLATSKAILDRTKSEFPVNGAMNELSNVEGDNHNTNSSGVAVNNNVVVTQQPTYDDSGSGSMLFYILSMFIIFIIVGVIMYLANKDSKKSKNLNNNNNPEF